MQAYRSARTLIEVEGTLLGFGGLSQRFYAVNTIEGTKDLAATDG